jgi:hypothetical protein
MQLVYSRHEMGGTFSSDREGRGVYGVFVGKPKGKRPLGTPRCRWQGNNNVDLQEIGYEGMDWIELAQDRDRWRALVNEVMSLSIK